MNTKLHAVTDAKGRPMSFFMTTGQVSDYIGAAALLDELPKAQRLLGDQGYDSDRFRDVLQAKGIQPCILGRKSRNQPIKYDKRRYRCRYRIEILVRPPQELGSRRHMLRPLLHRFLLRRRSRCHRHLLAMIYES